MTTNNSIVVLQEFNVPPPLLWKYLTQLEHMKEWFFKELWKYKEYPGDSEVIFEISSSPKGSILKLTANILKSFPAIEEFSRESMQSGWTDLIQTRLKGYLSSL